MAFYRAAIKAALNEAFSDKGLGSIDKLNEGLESLDEKTAEQAAERAINALSAHASGLKGKEARKFFDLVRNKLLQRMYASEDTPNGDKVNEDIVNEGYTTVKYEATGQVYYDGPMFKEQAQNAGESEETIANMMAHDLGLVDGSIIWNNDEFTVMGKNSSGSEIYLNQKGEYNMYGGPYSPKMGKFKTTLDGKNMNGKVGGSFKSYGWVGKKGDMGDADIGRTDIYGHHFRG